MAPQVTKLTMLRPKWLALHVLAIVLCLVMLWLGRWQWRAARRPHGEFINYAYAFQWWAFVGFTIVMWYRIMNDYLNKHKAKPEQEPMTPEPAEQRFHAYLPPTALPEETDPERLRFNAYLAGLEAHDREGAE